MQLNELKIQNEELKNQLNIIDQQQRRKNIRLIGLEEEKDEDLFTSVRETLSKKLELEQSDIQVDCCYRIKNNSKRNDPNSPGPVVVHFSTVRSRDIVFCNKRKLKGSRLTIAEDLSRHNYNLLKKCMSTVGKHNAWSINGRVYAKIGSEKIFIRSDGDLNGCDVGEGRNVRQRKKTRGGP